MREEFDHIPKFDIKTIILRLWRYKWLLLTSVVICLIFTYFHNKFTPTIYQNSLQISIDLQEQRSTSGRNERFQSINISNEIRNLENELGKMNSFPLVKSTLTKLDYELSYHLMEKPFRFKFLKKLPYTVTKELFEDSPFRVKFYRSHDQIIDTKFFISFLTDSTFRMEVKANETKAYNYIDNKFTNSIKNLNIQGTYKFGEIIESEYYKFYIDRKDSTRTRMKSTGQYYFSFHHMDYLTLYYLNNLRISPTTPTSSLINISLTGTHYQKITQFLNQLAREYINKDLEEKNREAKSTIAFIENQISDVASSLSWTGSNLEKFRSQHRIVDLDFQGQNMYERLNELESQKASMLMQKKYYEEISDYIRKNKVSELMAPSSMNINDPNLNTLISRLTELNSDREAATSQSQRNLFEENLNKRIENLKNTVLENVNTNLKNIDISLKDMDYRINKLSGELSALPATELQYQAIKRRFELNDEIYTYLLTKRAEAQIAQASNFPAYEIVDPARNLDYKTISPKTRLNYMIALMAGLLIPVAMILVWDFFNTRIKSISDIEHITNLPVIGNIARSRSAGKPYGITKFNHSVVSESIRMLRTNLQILNGQVNQIFLITSSSSNEGKTFSAIHLAQGFSLLDKKTLLIGYDLRKPKLSKLLQLPNEKGMSTYLSGINKASEIIQNTQNPHLDVITEGPLAPNPTELIASEKTTSFFQYLRALYDFIIVDTSPIGIVPDSKIILKNSDINLLMVRQSQTKKNELINTLKSLKNGKSKNFYLVMNDYAPKHDQLNYLYKYYSSRTSSDKSQALYSLRWLKSCREIPGVIKASVKSIKERWKTKIKSRFK
jgi:capsular exopolysaccharide synthesis family protein